MQALIWRRSLFLFLRFIMRYRSISYILKESGTKVKDIICILLGIILLSIGPKLILGIIFTAGIYYFLYMLFTGLFGGSSCDSGGGGSHDESDPGDGWHGTGNPYV